jgi:hypothetical protein
LAGGSTHRRFGSTIRRLARRPRSISGARKDILRWITHGPEGDIVDLYTTLPWHTLCEEVARLKIDLETAPKTAPKTVAPDPAKYAKLHERHLHFAYTVRNPEQFPEVTKRGGRDLKTGRVMSWSEPR